MNQTYAQVTRQIAALQSKAEQLRQREIEGVVERIKAAIEAYGLTAEHLFGEVASPSRRTPAGGAGKRVARQQYGDGQGNVWGGMGPRPQWLRQALAEGRSLEEFAAANSSRPATKPKARRGRKRPARQAYSDGSQTWSGFGRRPKWLQDALASGKNLDELKVATAS